jgi:hypothetical protein
VVKYKRVPKAKPGQIITTWAHRKYDGPDLYFINGEGTSRADRSLMNHVFCCKRMTVDTKSPVGYDFGPSFAEELEKRGYDMTTFRFSIQKKATT